MRKYIILDDNRNAGKRKGNIIFCPMEILSGVHVGKFAVSILALQEFPEILESEPYEVADLEPTAFQIDYTPPAMSGKGVIIPDNMAWVFRDDKFEIGSFVVDFTRIDEQLAVDIAYLGWEAFREELDKPENAAVKRHLEPIWDYAVEEISKGNLIEL